MNSSLIGALILAVPAVVLAYAALWRRERPVFWFACVLIAIGLGYLVMTGAAADIGRSWAPSLATAPTIVPAR